jgi:hypothetical protein
MNFTPTAPTRLIFGDAANRDANLYPTGSNYVLHLTRPVRNVERVELVSARVPNTMYNLVNGSNVLTVNSSNVSMNPGFYSVYTLAQAISSQTASPIGLDYIPSEGHFIFSGSPQFSIKIHSQELATMLGVVRGQTLTSVLAGPTDPAYTGKYIIRSSTLVDMATTDMAVLDIEELRTPFNVDTGALQGTTGTISGSNINRCFAPIILDVGSGCYKSFTEGRDYRVSIDYPEPINSLQRLTVHWIDTQGKPLNFQGLDNNTFILRLYLTPDPEPTLPPPPPLEDTQIRRIVQAMTMVPKPPKEEPKKRFHWWLIVLVLLGLIIAWKTWSRHQAQPMQVPRGPMVAGPVQGFQSLR